MSMPNQTVEDMADPPGVPDDKAGAHNDVEDIGPPPEHPAIESSRHDPPPRSDGRSDS